jgi:hypothetical protein
MSIFFWLWLSSREKMMAESDMLGYCYAKPATC